MLIPFMTYFGIDFGGALPRSIFPGIGMILAVFFFIVSKGYAIRLQAVGETYQRLIEKLPKEMQRTRTTDINKNIIYNINMCNLIVHVMFMSLLAMGLILLHICW